MKENFCIQRLQALLLRFWVEKKGSLILPVVIMVLFFVLLTFPPADDAVKEGFGLTAIFVLSKLLFMVFMVFHLRLAFAKGSGSVKCKLFHLLPASAAEKFVYLLLVGFVLPLAFYMLILMLLAALQGTINSVFGFVFLEVEVFGDRGDMNKISLLLKLFTLLFYYLIFHLLVWGLITFKDYAVLKVLGIFYLAYSIFTFVVFQLFNAKFWIDFIDTAKRYATDSPEYYTQLSWTLFVIFFTLISGLFYVNYKLFKRKEIRV